MKRFIIDQLLFLAIGIIIMISIPYFCGSVFTTVTETVVVVCWSYLCRRILLLPFDLLIGKVTQLGYFSCQCGIEDLEFFKDMGCYEWKFFFENNQIFQLLVPTAIKTDNAIRISQPKKNVKLRVTYFRLSRILIDWEIVNNKAQN